MRPDPGILRGARALIADPKAWTKYVHARDVNGIPVSYGAPSAVCFCVDGAIRSAGGGRAEIVFLAKLLGQPVFDWQDSAHVTHAMVLDLFDRAIVAAEQGLVPA